MEVTRLTSNPNIQVAANTINVCVPKTHSHKNIEDVREVTKAICNTYSNYEFHYFAIANYGRGIPEAVRASGYAIPISNVRQGLGLNLRSDFNQTTGEYSYGCPKLQSLGIIPGFSKAGVPVGHEWDTVFQLF